MLNHQDDRELVERLVAGQHEAYSQIDKWILPKVRALTRGLEEYFDEITQDIRIGVWNNLKRGQFKFKSSLETYVRKITSNTCVDYLRAKSARKLVPSDPPGGDDTPEDIRRKREERKLLWRVYRLMSKDCQRLWKMLYWEDLSYQEIADKLSIPIGTVGQRIHRCKKTAGELREKLEKREFYRLIFDC